MIFYRTLMVYIIYLYIFGFSYYYLSYEEGCFNSLVISIGNVDNECRIRPST